MEHKQQIAIIGTVGVPARYGGFETMVHNLVLHLGDKYDFTVYCSALAYEEQLPTFGKAKLRYVKLNANGLQSIPYDIVSMISAIRAKSDLIFVVGVSGAIFLPVLRLLTKQRIIVHLDGLEWKRNKWRSYIRKFLKFSEYLGVKYGDVAIADNSEIARYVREEYGKESCLIEYGADHITQDVQVMKGDYAFSVCRIEPENNIHVILQAFLQSGHPLKFVGNWEKSEYGKDLYNRYKAAGNIELLAPIYDQRKLDELRAGCKVYIHGHSAGGTNPALVEAMYLGLPIFAYDVSYNRATTEHKSVYFSNEASLIKLVASTRQDELDAIARDMAEIARRRYTWATISEKYSQLFDGR